MSLSLGAIHLFECLCLGFTVASLKGHCQNKHGGILRAPEGIVVRFFLVTS